MGENFDYKNLPAEVGDLDTKHDLTVNFLRREN